MKHLLLIGSLLFAPVLQAAPLTSAKETQEISFEIMKLFLSENFTQGLNLAK